MTAADIGYVETHGTGTALGDPIEVQALAAVLGRGRDADEPAADRLGEDQPRPPRSGGRHRRADQGGAVPAARRDPAAPALRQAQPAHRLGATCPSTVPTEAHALDGPRAGRRIAGVSSFGFSGTNAHVVLEEAPETLAAASQHTRPLHPLCLSARSRSALQAEIEQLQAFLGSKELGGNPVRHRGHRRTLECRPFTP